ncbi:MAG TPA: hypothetical protein VKG21_12810 [Casimicrobiaceae bacterium]|nr:hypothetical protein [Casimicrobiaceae bacterium]
MSAPREAKPSEARRALWRAIDWRPTLCRNMLPAQLKEADR